MGEEQPILTKFGKVIKAKNLEKFIQYGLKDGVDIYQDKKQRLPTLAIGTEGWFECHEARWTSGIKNIMDSFTDKTPKEPEKEEPEKNKTIQEIHNEDFMEFQRKTEHTTGKTDNREVFVSLDSVRIYGDLSNEGEIREKISQFWRHRDYFEEELKKRKVTPKL